MKKSKFLKKSLAMLLALMLVVAMIPLSASASPISLGTIYVDGNKVTIGSNFTVDVYTTAEEVEVGTNEDLMGLVNNKHQLRAAVPGSVTEEPIVKWDATTKTGTTLDFDTYADENDQITLKLYDMTTNQPNGKLEATYVMKLNKVTANTETNLASVKPGIGVYKILNSIEEINATKTIKVQVARNTENGSFQPTIDVTTANGAVVIGETAVNGVYEDINAGEEDSFEVKSASGTNVSKFTVEVEYLDALESFTITGMDNEDYTAQILDTDKNDIPDTIAVTLADEAIQNTYGEPVANPKLEVNYVANGNIDSNLTIAGEEVETGDEVTFTGLDDDTAYEADVVVTRLPKDNTGSQQKYRLIVQMEKSSSTVIESVMMNNTEADVTGDPITAELPANWIGTDAGSHATDLKAVNVVITTPDTVKDVVINGVSGVRGTPAHGSVTWTWGLGTSASAVDLSTEKTVTVFAEDGSTMAQTGIVATMAEAVSSATITAFSLGDGTGNTYPAESIANNVITVRVPYMTTNVSGWRVYATPSNSAKVIATNASNVTMDVINGTTTASAMGLTADITDVKNGLTSAGTITAVSKNDEKVKSTYTVKVVLETAKTGDQLQGLDFTVQPVENTVSGKGDKTISRAMTETNSFHANVAQATNSTNSVGEVNMKIPPSLTDANDFGVEYANIVTGIQNEAGAVIYKVVDTANASDIKLERLNSITTTLTVLTGSLISENSEIVALPEEIARQVELGTAEVSSAGTKSAGWIDRNVAIKHGTIYDVVIDDDVAETGAELKTIKIGEKELTINPDMTITGELPWSYTAKDVTEVDKATFMEFSMSDYAALFDEDDRVYFSKGDWNGDGVEDAIGKPDNATISDYANRKLLFKRNADGTVTVYVYAGSTINATEHSVNNLVVKGENRLNTPSNDADMSATTYTFKLTYAQPSNETVISNFKLGNYTGSVEGQNITVNVPYGTDVTGLIATFDKSIGATIRVNDRVGGVELVSGVTSVNYTNPVKLYVTSESKNNTVEYTVTVNQGLHFSDIDPDDWFYNNVMDAANNGYVTGYPDGTFQPKKATTRAEFASMIANAMGYESEPSDSDTMFPDVANDFWAKAAINFCAQNGIIEGYDDGTFKPNQTITRQEAAAILNNAFDLAEKYGISDEQFPDDGKIANWASDHVYAAKASGLMNGDKDTGNFRPTDTIKRCEAASILMNANRAGLIK